MMAPIYDPPIGPCEEWGRARNKLGYGVLGVGGRTLLAHRHAWTVAHGPIPPGMCVLHKCDNPPCINIDHLFLGTVAENNADRVAKCRTYSNKSAVHCPHGHLYDETNTGWTNRGEKFCRVCNRAATLRYYARKRVEAASALTQV